MQLSDIVIKNLKPASKAKKYADGDGLFLFVSSKGTKSWRFRYRDFAGLEQEMTFGKYPEIGLQDARRMRFEARQLLENGKDPKHERKERERKVQLTLANSFNEVAKEWYDISFVHCTPKHRQKVWNSLDNHVFKTLGKRPISSIDALEFLNGIIRPIERVGNTDLSHNLLCYCSSIFRYAVITKRVPYNPLADLKGILKPHKRNHLPSFGIAELPDFLEALDNFKAAEIRKIAIKMLLLTFVRTKELRQAEWKHFDFDNNLWVIPKEIMKMRNEHIVPLSKQVIVLLNRLRELSGNSRYLFPPINVIKHPFMNENAITNILKHKDMGYSGKIVGHGFRSLASTTLNELGWYHPQVIEKQLAHEETNKVKAAYNRAQYLPQRTELMQRWADYIDSVILEHSAKKKKYVA